MPVSGCRADTATEPEPDPAPPTTRHRKDVASYNKITEAPEAKAMSAPVPVTILEDEPWSLIIFIDVAVALIRTS